ncbi:hypothetical protein [Acuticoccus sp.]|uniref:hypothetical protein n=1 Tax=Acuticoccus sp. TaxID=1904378 RepID=UPI003B52D1DD
MRNGAFANLFTNAFATFMVAPLVVVTAVGSVMAELIANGQTNAPLAPFSIARFAEAH